VTKAWLDGTLGAAAIDHADMGPIESLFGRLCQHVTETLHANLSATESARRFFGKVAIAENRITRWTKTLSPGVREREFTLELRSQVVGDETLVRCTSPIGPADLNDGITLDKLYDVQRDLGTARLCARLVDHHRSSMSIELDRLFHLQATQPEEMVELVTTVVLQADRVQREIYEPSHIP
jgi:ABC-type phosphonate transport system ATPase subunit